MELNREEAQRCLDEMKRETNILMSHNSSSLQHCKEALNQSYVGASFQNQGTFGEYSLP